MKLDSDFAAMWMGGSEGQLLFKCRICQQRRVESDNGSDVECERCAEELRKLRLLMARFNSKMRNEIVNRKNAKWIKRVKSTIIMEN